VKVLVTGGRGMLGAATARAIADAGHTVTVLQRGDADLPFQQIRADICDASALGIACRDQDAVVHLAARVSITGPWTDFYRTNVHGTKELLRAARLSGVQRFVYVSSPSVAHAGQSIVGGGADPADPERARSSYSRSKAIAENLVLAESDMATVAIRPHLVWGPGDEQLVGRIVDRAKRGRLVLIDQGTALIDTTYVDNAAEALVAAVQRAAEPQVRGRAFVVSNGEPRTVRELLSAITRAAGVPEPVRSVPAGVARAAGRIVESLWQLARRTDEPPMTQFLAEQLSTAHWFAQQDTRAALQWAPRVGLDEGFGRLAAWHAKNL
jgi:2-alkyl-3-oxoalkanoate reductase